jgi:hypothetical protein
MEIVIFNGPMRYHEYYRYVFNTISVIITIRTSQQLYEEFIRYNINYLYSRAACQNIKFSKIKFYCSP